MYLLWQLWRAAAKGREGQTQAPLWERSRHNQTLSQSSSTGEARGLCIILKHRLFTTSSPPISTSLQVRVVQFSAKKCPKIVQWILGWTWASANPSNANVRRRDLYATINTYGQMVGLNGKKARREPVEVNYTQVYQQPMLICGVTIESLVQLPPKLPAAFSVQSRQDAVKLVWKNYYLYSGWLFKQSSLLHPFYVMNSSLQ